MNDLVPGSDRSPYARALGDQVAALHPTLQRYFDTIPPGTVGIGTGVFDRIGTPRRWLRPALRLLQRRGVVWAGWGSEVPFSVVNRTVRGRAVATRRIDAPSGTWEMRDAVALTPTGQLVDEIGAPSTVAAVFALEVRDGGLLLESRRVGLRWGRIRVRVPRWAAPVVRLHERFDAACGRQRVDVTIDVPVLGRVYEYGGSFTYRVEADPHAA